VDELHLRRIARLARIDLTEEEVGRLLPQLESVMGYFDKLRELDTEGVEPLVHAVEESNVLMPDEPGGSLSQEEALANAPRHDGSFFCVPRILGGET
jgi:aspartyl-tRNA(Asn)/glutamyl-tRNA(Gln) amidotransferase subunit C